MMSDSSRPNGAYIWLKPGLDIMAALVACAILAPVLVLIALVIRLDSKGPVFFLQQRVGVHKQPFKIVKFRTMYVDAPRDTPTHLLSNSDRHITRVGRVLRRTSLDEVPQILNVLTGTMSFVGPRPALWNQYDLIVARDQYGANDVMPGITGLAQVSGRDELAIEAKARIDGEYVARIGLLTDLTCVWQTLMRVVRGDGVVEGRPGDGESTTR